MLLISESPLPGKLCASPPHPLEFSGPSLFIFLSVKLNKETLMRGVGLWFVTGGGDFLTSCYMISMFLSFHSIYLFIFGKYAVYVGPAVPDPITDKLLIHHVNLIEMATYSMSVLLRPVKNCI